MTDQENRQLQEQLFAIYCGILFNSPPFAPGERTAITYRFDCPEYKTLIGRYGIDSIAGEGTDFQRAERLLHWMSPRLTHEPNYDNHVPMNSLALLEYSLDKPKQGINCRNKSVILTECCLALGITARRVYIFPYSPYDADNHVVTEIFDRERAKWMMLDPSTDGVFRDEKGVPLSILELRERFSGHKPARFTGSEDENEINAYFAKNLYRFVADGENGFGLGDKVRLYFTPEGYRVQENRLKSMEYTLDFIPPDAMRMRRTFTEMLEKAKADPEPGTWDISAMEMKP